MALLEVDQLQTHFRTPDGGVNRAVDGVSFRLAAGDVLELAPEALSPHPWNLAVLLGAGAIVPITMTLVWFAAGIAIGCIVGWGVAR